MQPDDSPPIPGGVLTRATPATPFEVHLESFSGPFDLLLGLISAHTLDVTELALAQVTDDFLAHIQGMRSKDSWDLGQMSHFVLVAATLLELKAARLLPEGMEYRDEDLALMEARDLLFARLLQYRAYKDVAADFALRIETFGRVFPRSAGVDADFVSRMPPVEIGVDITRFAQIAAQAMIPKPPPEVGVQHLHRSRVNMAAQAAKVMRSLQANKQMTFAQICADTSIRIEIVARFLTVLELLREKAVDVEQSQPLGPLHLTWIAGSTNMDHILDRYSQEDENEDSTK